MIYAGVLVAIAVGTWLVLRSSGVSSSFVTRQLAQILDPQRFRLGSAQVDLGGGVVTLSDFSVRTGEAGNRSTASLRAERVEIGVGTNPLRDPGTLRSVRAEGVVLEIDLIEGRLPDLTALLAARETDTGREPAAPPPILVERGELLIRFAPDTPALRIGDLGLELLPTEAGSWQFGITGRGTGPRDEGLTIEGHWDLAADVGAVQLRATDFAIDPDSIHAYHPAAGEFLADAHVRGQVTELTLHAARAGADQQMELSVSTHVEELALQSSALPYPLEGASAEATFRPFHEGGSLQAKIVDHGTDGNFEARAKLTALFDGERQVDLEVVARDVLVRPAIGQALRNVPEARLAWDAFQPRGGRANAHIRFHHPSPVEGREQQFGLELELFDVGATFIGMAESDGARRFGFPHPLTGLHGTVTVRDGVVGVDDVRGRLGDEGTIRVDGRIVTESRRAPDVDLVIEGDDLPFSAQMLDALRNLDSRAATVWEEYQPAGRARLRVDVRVGPGFESGGDAEAAGVAVRIEPLLASASYADFPVRVDDIVGSIEIRESEILVDLEGQRGGAPLAVRVAVHDDAGTAADPDRRFATEVRIVGQDIRPDDEFDAALRGLGPELAETLDLLGLRSGGDVDLHLWRRRAGEDLDYDLRVDLEDGTAELKTLGLPFRDLTGPVFVHGNGSRARIEVGGVRGHIDQRLDDDAPPPSLFVHGVVDTAPASGPHIDLTAVVEGLRLTEEVGAAIDRYEAFDLESWRVLDPRGVVDLVWRQHGDAGPDGYSQDLQVQLRGVRSAAPFLPAPAESLFGDLMIRDGEATLEHIRGTMAGKPVFCDGGFARHEDRATRISFQVSCPEFPIDDRLANLLEGPLRETYLAREVRGTAAVESLIFDFLFPDDSDSFETRIRGVVIAQDVAMTLGTRVQKISGSWTIEDSWFTDDSGSIKGRVDNGGASLHGHRLTGGTARFEADIDSVRFHDVLCRLHLGRVRGAATSGPDAVYRFADDGDLSFSLEWENLSLASLLEASAVQDANLRGNLAGHFTLEHLPGARLHEAVGSGDLRISDADLGKVPAFRAIYSYLERPRRPTFERLSTELDVRDHRISFSGLQLVSPLLEVEGKGSIGMDGYVDLQLDFPDFFGKSADWTLIPQLVRMLSNQIVQFHLFGDLRNPKVEPVWLGQDTPSRPPLEPIPPPTTRRGGGP